MLIFFQIHMHCTHILGRILPLLYHNITNKREVDSANASGTQALWGRERACTMKLSYSLQYDDAPWEGGLGYFNSKAISRRKLHHGEATICRDIWCEQQTRHLVTAPCRAANFFFFENLV